MDFTGFFSDLGNTISGASDTVANTVSDVSGSIASVQKSLTDLFGSGQMASAVPGASGSSVFPDNKPLIYIGLGLLGLLILKKLKVV